MYGYMNTIGVQLLYTGTVVVKGTNRKELLVKYMSITGVLL